MKSKFFPLLLAAAVATSASGQILMVDASGTRGLGSVFSGGGADSHDFKFDSGKRSANATYVYNVAGETARLYGVHAQASVPDSWINLAKRNPNAELSGIFNVTWRNDEQKPTIDYFVTSTFGAKGDDQQWRTSATAPVQTSYEVTAQARITFGVVPLPAASLFSGAVTIGVNRESNLAQLKQVEVGGKKSARA